MYTLLFMFAFLPQAALLAIFHGPAAFVSAAFLVLGEGELAVFIFQSSRLQLFFMETPQKDEVQELIINRRRDCRSPLRSLLCRRNARRRLRCDPPLSAPRSPALALTHHLPRSLKLGQSPRSTHREGRIWPVQLPPDCGVCAVPAAEFHSLRRCAAVLGAHGKEGGTVAALEVF